MAQAPLQAAPPPANHHERLRALEKRAYEYENAVRRVEAIFHAIREGGLLDEIPPGDSEMANHLAAVNMLELASEALQDLQDESKMELSGEMFLIIASMERTGHAIA